MQTRYVVNSPNVVSEVIDGEAVILNQRSGMYFSTRDLGAVIWSAIENELDFKEIDKALREHFKSDKANIGETFLQFWDELKQHKLIREESQENSTNFKKNSFNLSEMLSEFQTYTAPKLESYNDMKDLLLLDPIHDVDESGWPMPKQN